MVAKAIKEFDDKAEEETVVLKRVQCIHYLLCFQKDTANVRTLIDLDNKINAMILAFVSKLCFKAYHTNVWIQKIESSTIKTLKMILANF